MSHQLTIVYLCAIVLFVPSSLLGDELRFGSPAPHFSANMFRGKAVKTAGQIHVVEFGGTTCVPCIRLIPYMNALQDRYPDVVFVSVFCENLDAVKSFLKGPGKEMRVRIATDESGRMRKEWLDAGGLEGVPQAFIVDRTGHLAWFGYPEEPAFGVILK